MQLEITVCDFKLQGIESNVGHGFRQLRDFLGSGRGAKRAVNCWSSNTNLSSLILLARAMTIC